MPESVVLHFGLQGVADFNRINNEVNEQPAGGNFYRLRWNPPTLGLVTVQTEGSNTIFEHVFSVMGVQWGWYSNEGIASMTIKSGISESEYIKHQEAYQRAMALVAHLVKNGWQDNFSWSEARIAKEDRFRYLNEPAGSVLYPEIPLTFKEWMNQITRNEYITYYLTNGGVKMTLHFQPTILGQNEFDKREVELDFKEWGQYMLDIEITSWRYSVRNRIDNIVNSDEFIKDISDEELLGMYLEMLPQWEQERKVEELVLKSRGYRINEQYPLPDLTPYLQKEFRAP